MPTPWETLLERYWEELERVQRAEGLSDSWTSTMKAYTKRFLAWLEGRPDWWMLRSYD